MKKSNLVMSLLMLLVLSTSLVFAGGSKETVTPAAAASGAPQIEIDASRGKVKIVFWHSMGGRNKEALDKLVTDYNASQNKVEVEAQYQGTYDDAITKLRSTGVSAAPEIMQMYDIGTRWTIDSGYALKMQDFINADKYDISDYEKNILAYYTVDGALHSMPFNSSSPVLIYNKEALAKAGLNPDTAFATLDSLRNTAEQLQTKGGVAVGGSMTNYSWIFEQLISIHGEYLTDNENGRTARATKVVIDENGAGMEILSRWKEIAASPYTDTFGKGTAESKKQFAQGTVGFIFDSCSVYVDVSAAAGGSFSVGFAPVPRVTAADTGGVSVGGGSLWIMDKKDPNKAAAAWDFIKYVTQPKQQAEWAIGTGYLPIRTSAVELDFFQDYLKNINPELMVAITSLRGSNAKSTGAVMGVFPKARVIMENEIETMINSPSVTAQATLDKIVSQINSEITLYNRTN